MKGSSVEVAPSDDDDSAFDSPRTALEYVKAQGISDAVLRFQPQAETLPLYVRLTNEQWYLYQASGL